MKNLFTMIVLFLGVTIASAQEKTEDEIITALTTYAGSNNDIYYFKNEVTKEIISFSDVDEKAITQANLVDTDILGNTFTVKYKVIKVEVDSKDEVTEGERTVVKSFISKNVLFEAKNTSSTLNQELIGSNSN